MGEVPAEVGRLWLAALLSLLLHALVLQGPTDRVFVPEAGEEGGALIVTFAQRGVGEKMPPLEDANQRLAGEQEGSAKEPSTSFVSSGLNDRLQAPEFKYWPVGLLTKLPRPLDEIDLNAPEITSSAQTSKIHLMLSLSAAGLVEGVEVVSGVDELQSSAWLEQVVRRFRRARFSPGELGGKAVPSEVPVTVIVQ